MIEIIEVDQWTASGDIEKLDFDTVTLQTIKGGDSEAAKSIFGGHFERKQVSEDKIPTIGNVWYIKGPDGKCKLYKYHFDTSG